MAALTVRKISPESHRALRVRAAGHGRSTVSELRAILDEAVRDKEVDLGTFRCNLDRELGGADFGRARDQSPARAVDFG